MFSHMQLRSAGGHARLCLRWTPRKLSTRRRIMLSLVRKVKPCENVKELDELDPLDAEGICLNKCRSTVKLSLPQHNDTVGMKKSTTWPLSQHLFNVTYHGCHVLMHPAVSSMPVTLNLHQLSKLCISLPCKLETSPFTSAKLQVMRRQSDKTCLATMSVLRQSHPFCLQRRGWHHVSMKRCVCVSCDEDKTD